MVIKEGTMSIIAEGRVFGNFWGGGKGVFTARELKTETIEALRTLLSESKDIGEFDGGMGYEKVTGVIYYPVEVIQEGEWTKTRNYVPIFTDRGMPEEHIDWFLNGF